MSLIPCTEFLHNLFFYSSQTLTWGMFNLMLNSPMTLYFFLFKNFHTCPLTNGCLAFSKHLAVFSVWYFKAADFNLSCVTASCLITFHLKCSLTILVIIVSPALTCSGLFVYRGGKFLFWSCQWGFICGSPTWHGLKECSYPRVLFLHLPWALGVPLACEHV